MLNTDHSLLILCNQSGLEYLVYKKILILKIEQLAVFKQMELKVGQTVFYNIADTRDRHWCKGMKGVGVITDILLPNPIRNKVLYLIEDNDKDKALGLAEVLTVLAYKEDIKWFVNPNLGKRARNRARNG